MLINFFAWGICKEIFWNYQLHFGVILHFEISQTLKTLKPAKQSSVCFPGRSGAPGSRDAPRQIVSLYSSPNFFSGASGLRPGGKKKGWNKAQKVLLTEFFVDKFFLWKKIWWRDVWKNLKTIKKVHHRVWCMSKKTGGKCVSNFREVDFNFLQ